jgi:hypothetical protein
MEIVAGGGGGEHAVGGRVRVREKRGLHKAIPPAGFNDGEATGSAP